MGSEGTVVWSDWGSAVRCSVSWCFLATWRCMDSGDTGMNFCSGESNGIRSYLWQKHNQRYFYFIFTESTLPNFTIVICNWVHFGRLTCVNVEKTTQWHYSHWFLQILILPLAGESALYISYLMCIVHYHINITPQCWCTEIEYKTIKCLFKIA
jgi:hypothetical protein